MKKGEVYEYQNDCNTTTQREFEEPIVQDLTCCEEPVLLLPEPDAPILKGFQQKLKEYLVRVKDQLSDEIADIRYALKKRKDERNEAGIQLYDLQEQVKQQKALINIKEEEAQNINERRQKLQDKVQLLKNEYVEILGISKEKKRLCNKRSAALQQTLELEMNIRKWAEDADDDVKNAKRAVKKDFQMQRKISEEKKKSDMLFYKMDVEIRNYELELESLRNEILKLNQNINTIKIAISEADSDLEVVQNEDKNLVQSWQEVILAVQNRDKILFSLHSSITKIKDQMQSCTLGITGIKKQLSKEVAQNKQLELFNRRLRNDFNALERQYRGQSDTYTTLITKLEKLPLLLEQTEKDLREANTENNVLTTEMHRLDNQLDKKSNRKYELEESILKLAEDHLITDKANQFRVKLFTASQDTRRKLELMLAQITEQMSSLLLQMERCKCVAFKLRNENENLKVKHAEIEENHNFMEVALKNVQADIDDKLKRIDQTSNALNDFLRKKSDELSPTETKIKALEKDLQVISKESHGLELFWVTVQNHYVHLSQKRDEQLNDLKTAQKQLSIIRQKAMKIDFKLEELDAYTLDLTREIKTYKHKVELLNVKMYKKLSQHEVEEKECLKEHQELIQSLKDSEMNVLRIEEDIKNLEVEVEQLRDLVLSKHREALSWEAKYKLLEETLRWYKNQTCFRSDISQIRTEIHRMQVRYNQLKRAQEKLLQDVEQCVIHREQIFISANTKRLKETQTLRSNKNTITALQHKVMDLQQKVKLVQRDIKISADQHLNEAHRENETIKNDIKYLSVKLNEEAKQDEHLKKSMEECFLLKHLNLETIVRKQHRSKSYRRLSCGIPKATRSENTMIAQNKKLMDVNEKLTETVQILIEKYPAKKHPLYIIVQTLRE